MNTKELGKLKGDAKKAYKAWNAHKTERDTERDAAIAKAYEDCTAQVWDADPARKAGEHLEAVKKALIDDRGAWTKWCGVEDIPISTADRLILELDPAEKAKRKAAQKAAKAQSRAAKKTPQTNSGSGEEAKWSEEKQVLVRVAKETTDEEAKEALDVLRGQDFMDRLQAMIPEQYRKPKEIEGATASKTNGADRGKVQTAPPPTPEAPAQQPAA